MPALAAHSQQTIAGNFYVGPKEYPRLSNADVFKKDEDRVMDFGNFVFRFCAAILLTVMSINLVGEGLNDALNPRLRTL